MTATEIGKLLAAHSEATAAFLLPGGKRHGREWLAGSVAGEVGGSLHVVLEGDRAGMWRDFAGTESDKGDLIGLWQRARNVTMPQACKEALDWMQVPESVRTDRSRQPVIKPAPKPRVPDQRWLDLQATMRAGTYSDLSALATLRGLSTACLELATRHGHLFFGNVHDSNERHPAWILTDPSRRHAQARKMDGSLWNFGGSHKPAKSKTIWGTDPKWPVGIANADTPEICLVEGAPDFLAAWHFIWSTGNVGRASPVAMFGTNTSIGSDALPRFAGKTVRIFPHNDDKGQGISAAQAWTEELKDTALKIIFYDIKPHGVKDLNELMRVEAEMETEA